MEGEREGRSGAKWQLIPLEHLQMHPFIPHRDQQKNQLSVFVQPGREMFLPAEDLMQISLSSL